MNLYDLARGLHILAVIAWMAGLLFLPRLYAYDVEQNAKPEPLRGEMQALLRLWQTRLLRIIINPAMIVTWVLGLYMAWYAFGFKGGWLHGKLLLQGRDALAVLQRLCANQIDVPVGRLVYTAMLNARGGFESDLTVMRTGEQEFFVVTGTAPRLDIDLHRCAADRLQRREHRHLVADDDRTVEGNAFHRDRHRTAMAISRRDRTRSRIPQAHQPAAENIPMGIGIGRHGDDAHRRTFDRRLLVDLRHQASMPSGFSMSSRNAFIRRAPSAPSIAR